MLSAEGSQTKYKNPDYYLTGNPQITFFKSVYKRHTNFSSFWKKLDFQGTTEFGNKLICKINNSHGDLLGDLLFSLVLPKITASGADNVKWTSRIGHAMIEYITLKIGNREIVTHTGEWLELQSQLTIPNEKKVGYDNMIGDITNLKIESSVINEYQLYIPFQFWFCKDIGLALPLVSLNTDSDLEVIIKLRDFDRLIHKTSATTVVTQEKTNLECSLKGKFFLLEDKDRLLFQKSHKY